MKLNKISKTFGGKHLQGYLLEYVADDNRIKQYEMVSRNKDLKNLEDIQEWSSKTVLIVGISNDNKKVLLNREYRMAVGDWVYNFPSGMIDEGETPTQAAMRELKEETGLVFDERLVRLRSSYNAVGMTDESTSVVFAHVSGTIGKSDSSFEEIDAKWYTKEEVKELLRHSKMSARAQMFCFCWAYGHLQINKLAEETEDYEDGHLR